MKKIAIASGKGGTGKTFLSTNLAAWIAQKEAVTLLDLDAEAPNCHLFIQGERKAEEIQYKMIPHWDAQRCTLCGDCLSLCHFNALVKVQQEIMIFPQLCHSCYACSELCPEAALPMEKVPIGRITHIQNRNLDFFESRLNIGEEQAVPMISKAKKYAQNQSRSQITLYDSPPGTACPAVEAVKDAHLVILAAEPTPFGFHDFKLMLRLLNDLQKPIAVVINKYGTGDSRLENFCFEKNIHIIAKIPHSRKIAENYAQGKLALYADYKLQIEFEKIYQHILQWEGDLQ
jgi:MinD superfamily P-loop ATPase